VFPTAPAQEQGKEMWIPKAIQPRSSPCQECFSAFFVTSFKAPAGQVRFPTECCCGCSNLTETSSSGSFLGMLLHSPSCSAACAPALGFLPASRSCSADPHRALALVNLHRTSSQRMGLCRAGRARPCEGGSRQETRCAICLRTG